MSDTTRIDLRIPNDLLEEVRDIAKNRFNAKIHHISKQPEITSTLIKLIEYGIQFIEQGYTDNTPDNLPDKTIQVLTERVKQELSVNYPDINPGQLNPDNLPDIFLDKIAEIVSVKLSDKYPDKEGIDNYQTIQSMQAHIMKLDSYLDGLTKAIQEIMEVKAVSDPIPDDVPQLDSTLTSEVTLISSEGEEIITPETLLNDSGSPDPSSDENAQNPIEVKEDDLNTNSDNGETQRLTDREVQRILQQEKILNTSTQNITKWRKGQSNPRGLNKKILDHFKPDGDRWIRLNSS